MTQGKLARLVRRSPFVGVCFYHKDNVGFSYYGDKKNREGMVGREESEEWEEREGVLGFSFKDRSNHIR